MGYSHLLEILRVTTIAVIAIKYITRMNCDETEDMSAYVLTRIHTSCNA